MRLVHLHRFVCLTATLCLGHVASADGVALAHHMAHESGPGAESEAPAPLSPAQIGAVLLAANEGEIAQGRIAEQNAQNEEVRSFATTMVEHHTEMNVRVQALLEQLAVTPAPSTLEQSIRVRGASEVALLESVSGPLFDLVYVDGQVLAHLQVLLAIEDALLPSVQAENEELRGLLDDAKGAVTTHLMQAAELRRSLPADVPAEVPEEVPAEVPAD